MTFEHRTPCAALRPFVALLWYAGGAVPEHALERLMPDATVEIVLNVSDADCGVVSGPQTAACFLDTATQPESIGAHVHAGGALPFFGIPLAEMRDRTIDLEALWGADARALRSALDEARTLDARFDALERALLARASHGPAILPVVRFARSALDAPFAASVAAVRERTGLSERRFVSAFRDAVGLTPKVFARVRRFGRTLAAFERGAESDLAAIAAASGYFDQAHFAHDFRAFSGLSPSQYLAQRGEHFRHVPVPEATGVL